MTVFFAALGGIIFTLSQPGIGLLPCLFLGMGLFLYALEDAGWKEGAWCGLAFGICHFFSLLYWLVPTINSYGRLPIVLAVWPVLLLSIYLSVYTVAWGGIMAWLRRHGVQGWAYSLFGGALWGGLEWLRGHAFTGFPWGAVSISLHNHPMFLQTADVVGMYGVSALLVAALVVLWECMRAFSKNDLMGGGVSFFVLLVLFFSVISYGYHVMRSFKPCRTPIYCVACQGAFPQTMKWDPTIREKTVKRYLSLSQKGLLTRPKGLGPGLLIWPETAVTTYIQDDPALLSRLMAFSEEQGVYLLFGSPSYGFDTEQPGARFYNSAYLIGPEGEVLGRYDKRHLVPFGEYMPLGPFASIGKRYLPTVGDFEKGQLGPVIRVKAKKGLELNIGVLICFESIFPRLSRDAVRAGAKILAVITNDAWFGDTPAPFEHEAMSVMRAIETRRWVVRAANTGVSSIIDPFGQRWAQTTLFTPASLGHKACLLGAKTVFVRWGDAGFFLFLLLLSIPAAVLGVIHSVKNRRRIEE